MDLTVQLQWISGYKCKSAQISFFIFYKFSEYWLWTPYPTKEAGSLAPVILSLTLAWLQARILGPETPFCHLMMPRPCLPSQLGPRKSAACSHWRHTCMRNSWQGLKSWSSESNPACGPCGRSCPPYLWRRGQERVPAADWIHTPRGRRESLPASSPSPQRHLLKPSFCKGLQLWKWKGLERKFLMVCFSALTQNYRF